jgi:(2R)-3-sulfolactate dehydrogenase (NADP+)
MGETATLTLAELESLMTRALAASDVTAGTARSVARALTLAEADGQSGHGLSRVASYAAQARSGKVDGHAVPQLQQTRPGVLLIDAQHGFAYPALELAIASLPELARTCGIAAAAITRSHHCGVLAHPCEQLAEAGLVALAFANTPAAMSAWGGKRAVFGTNPIAFAAPRAGQAPIVVDLALSAVARGKVFRAAQTGETIPQSWALDADGKPTTDPHAALQGTLLPAGGAKGAALALMVEVLAAALVGSNLAFEASSFFDAEGAPPSVGQLLLALDPGAFGGQAAFAERLSILAAAIEDDGGARLPGIRRAALRKQAEHAGIIVNARLLAEVRNIAGD